MAGVPLQEGLDAHLAEFRELADSKRMAGNYLEQLARHSRSNTARLMQRWVTRVLRLKSCLR